MISAIEQATRAQFDTYGNKIIVAIQEFFIHRQVRLSKQLIIERLSTMLRQTANGKNETFAVCLQLYVRYSENIFICGE